MAKVAKLSQGAVQVLDILKEVETATAIDIKGKGFEGVNSAHFTALVNRGLVEAHDVEIEVPTVVKRKVKAYTITADGKAFKGE